MSRFNGALILWENWDKPSTRLDGLCLSPRCELEKDSWQSHHHVLPPPWALFFKRDFSSLLFSSVQQQELSPAIAKCHHERGGEWLVGKEACQAVGSSHCAGTKAFAAPQCGSLCPQRCILRGVLSTPPAQSAHGQHQPCSSPFHRGQVQLPLATELGQQLKDASMEECLLPYRYDFP